MLCRTLEVTLAARRRLAHFNERLLVIVPNGVERLNGRKEGGFLIEAANLEFTPAAPLVDTVGKEGTVLGLNACWTRARTFLNYMHNKTA